MADETFNRLPDPWSRPLLITNRGSVFLPEPRMFPWPETPHPATLNAEQLRLLRNNQTVAGLPADPTHRPGEAFYRRLIAWGLSRHAGGLT